MSASSTPPGWYPDPQNPAQQRYWDGSSWSEATQPASGYGAPGYGAPGYGQQVGYGYAQGGAYGGQMAGFWIRFAASLLDSLLIGIPFTVLGLLLATDDTTRVSVGVGTTPGAPPLLNLIQLVVGVTYYAMLEGGSTGQTLGKKVCGIRVVDATTYQPAVGVGRGVGRYFARWLSALPCLLGYFWMLWDEDKQTWHDKLTRTRIVKA